MSDAEPQYFTKDLIRWSETLAAIARTGMGFTQSLYEKERYEEVLKVAADIKLQQMMRWRYVANEITSFKSGWNQSVKVFPDTSLQKLQSAQLWEMKKARSSLFNAKTVGCGCIPQDGLMLAIRQQK